MYTSEGNYDKLDAIAVQRSGSVCIQLFTNLNVCVIYRENCIATPLFMEILKYSYF